MDKAGFEVLSDLVLVDTLAALPLRQALRLMRMAGPRLRQICSRRWVVRRMADVEFATVVEAHMAGADMKATFCTNAVLKKLYGKVVVDVGKLGDANYGEACLEIMSSIPYRHKNVVFHGKIR